MMITISVIIPFYNGNKYLNNLKVFLEKACKNYSKRVEVIVINDSPNITVNTELLISNDYELVLIEHKSNQGIHQARVSGVSKARGRYLLFLDQDDKINELFFNKMAIVLDADPSISFAFCNGLFTDETGKRKLILNSYGKVFAAKRYNSYFKVGNLLASPGQCLIRKSRIPQTWTTYIMKTNCSDDFLLWLLMLKHGEATYVNSLLYEHISTGENVSSDKLKGYLSDIELCHILEKTNEFPAKKIKKLKCKCINKYNQNQNINSCFYKIKLYKDFCIECIARLNMKIIGFLYLLIGKRICNKN